MPYTKKNPSPSNQYADTTLFQAFDDGIYGAHNRGIAVYDVRDYGGSGGGWDTRVADQNAHEDAFEAASAATWGGVVYTPPGEWYLVGGFTPGKRVVWQGGGNGRTIVSHYDTTTTLFASLSDGNTGGEYPQRGVKDLRIYGNSGASLVGLHLGNCTFAFLENLAISGYTAGSCIKLENTITGGPGFTENTRITGVQSFDSLIGLDIVAYANPRHSFGGMQINNCLFNAGIDNAIGVRISANALIYGAFISTRLVGERTTTTGLDINGTATVKDSLYQINSEGLPDSGQANGGTGVRLRTGGILTGKGIVSLEGSITNDIQSGTTYTVT